MAYRTRKEKLEKIAFAGRRLSREQSSVAWGNLMDCLAELSAEEFPRTPKFRDVLYALVAARFRAERGTSK